MAKPAITKRSVKGAALTYNELDTNFQNLSDATLSVTAGVGGTQVTSDLNGNITLVAGTGITLSGNNTTKQITINNTATQNSFTNIAVAGQGNIVADAASDTLNIAAGSNIVLTTDPATDTLTIQATGSGFGTVNSGAATALAFYPSAGTTVDDTVLNYSISLGDVVLQSNSTNGGLDLATKTGPYLHMFNSGTTLLATTIFQTDANTIRLGTNPNISVDATGGDFLGTMTLGGQSIRFPNRTTTQRDAIASPLNGMVLYNTTVNKLQVYANGSWVDLH